jgi:hypothetical protein
MRNESGKIVHPRPSDEARSRFDNAILRIRKRIEFIIYPSLIILLFVASSAFAQSNPFPEFTGVRVGLGDRYKTGLWTQVEIKIRGGNEMLDGVVSLTVPDGDDISSKVVKPCQVLPGRETTVRFQVRFGRVRSELKAEFLVAGGTKLAAKKTFETSFQTDENHFLEAIEQQPLVVVVGNSTAGVEEAVKLRDAASNDPNLIKSPANEVARVADVERLPVHWCGYEAVDALVICTSDAEMFRKLAPDDARIAALDDWLRMGGRLVFCVGSQADEILNANSALAAFAPGRFESIVTRDQTGPWEQFAGSSTPVPPPKSGEKIQIRCPKLDVSEGIEAREADLPLVVRTPHGLGQIVFVAADIDRPPFSHWNDRGLLVAKLLDFDTKAADETKSDQYGGGYGYNDLSGQLRSSLDKFSGVKVIPFALVALMIVGYILLIGPGDYFLLKKIFRRMEWTWFTFPLVVVAVSLGAYFLAYYLKGDQLRVNQVDLVDVDVATKQLRGATWLNIFSPRMESFDLSLEAREPGGAVAKNASGYFAWFGLPGDGLGGMNPRGGNPPLLQQSYLLWPDSDTMPLGGSSMEGVPIQVWSTKSFAGRWRADAGVVPDAELSETDGDLLGKITNPYDFPLENCIVAHRHWAYKLGTLAPGETKPLNNQDTERSELKTYLTGVQMINDGSDQKTARSVAEPYHMFDDDPHYVLRFMMFYEMSGGRNYVKLSNDYQSFADMSNLLKTGRAILLAGAAKNANESRRGAILLRKDQPLGRNQDTHDVIYRFVFPVKKK